jgi:outer membrane protein assembly factor BamB
VLGEQVIVAAYDGVLRALAATDGSDRWSFQTGGEILGTPAATSEIIVCGSGDGHVYGVSPAGERRWTYDAGHPVYGPPLLAGGVAYVGDNGGRMHALGVTDGARKWVFERADFTIEAQPVLWQELLVFGAWDGKVYALAAADGALRWKSDGPRTSAGGGGARYYAPADCPPVVLGDFLYVCDRGYALGRFDTAGRLLDNWELKVAGIAAARGGGALYGRTTDDRILKLGLDGKPLWEAARPAGRFPIPPTTTTTADETVLVCSNRGLLQALSAASGAVAWSYHVTPGFYVMAPVAVAEGVCYAAGMDGSVVAVRGQ